MPSDDEPRPGSFKVIAMAAASALAISAIVFAVFRSLAPPAAPAVQVAASPAPLPSPREELESRRPRRPRHPFLSADRDRRRRGLYESIPCAVPQGPADPPHRSFSRGLRREGRGRHFRGRRRRRRQPGAPSSSRSSQSPRAPSGTTPNRAPRQARRRSASVRDPACASRDRDRDCNARGEPDRRPSSTPSDRDH